MMETVKVLFMNKFEDLGKYIVKYVKYKIKPGYERGV